MGSAVLNLRRVTWIQFVELPLGGTISLQTGLTLHFYQAVEAPEAASGLTTDLRRSPALPAAGPVAGTGSKEQAASDGQAASEAAVTPVAAAAHDGTAATEAAGAPTSAAAGTGEAAWEGAAAPVAVAAGEVPAVSEATGAAGVPFSIAGGDAQAASESACAIGYAPAPPAAPASNGAALQATAVEEAEPAADPASAEESLGAAELSMEALGLRGPFEGVGEASEAAATSTALGKLPGLAESAKVPLQQQSGGEGFETFLEGEDCGSAAPELGEPASLPNSVVSFADGVGHEMKRCGILLSGCVSKES